MSDSETGSKPNREAGLRDDLDGIQETIQTIYRIDGTLRASDFHIDRALLSEALGADTDGHRETLVVQSDGDDTHLALFVCEEIMHRARAFAAGESERELDAFCVATEGVSHFVYFTFCGEQQERPVSQVELELQAEIDKFVVLRVLCPDVRADLVEQLFDHFVLHDRLAPEQRERYAVANNLGRRYARWLDRCFRRGRGEQALRDARQLYRKPLGAKVEHIARAA